MIFKYEIEVEIDEENISRKYPNYEINYSNPKEFADATVFRLESEGLEGLEDGIEKWGYSVKVKDINDSR